MIYPQIIAFVLMLIFMAFPILIFFLYSIWRVFEKCEESGWQAIIPFYNVWVLIDITGLKPYYIFIMLASYILPIISLGLLTGLGGLISLFGFFSAHYNLAKKFSKDPILYGLGLTFIPIIFYPILAFSQDAKYNSNIEVSPYGPILEETINNYQNKYSNSKQDSTKENNFCKNCGENVNNDKFCSKCGAEQKK